MASRRPNGDAIGAVVRTYAVGIVQSRMVKGGSSYLSQSELPVTFGLGAHDRVDRVVIEWPSGRTEEYKKRLQRKPEAIVEDAVRRMLPKNKLAAHMLSKLNVYKGDKHPHQAQKPQDYKLEVRQYKPRKVAVS